MAALPDGAIDAVGHPVGRELLAAPVGNDSRLDTVIRIPDGVAAETRETDSLLIDTYHNHLPRLEEGDFIRWNQDAQRVTVGPRFDTLRPLLAETTGPPTRTRQS